MLGEHGGHLRVVTHYATPAEPVLQLHPGDTCS